MKRTILIVLLVAAVLVCGGCLRQPNGAHDAERIATVHRSASADSATRDSATGDEARQATGDEPYESLLAAAQHPMNWKIDKSFFSGALKHASATLSTEELLQYPELPTGCESVAVTSALQTLGFSLEKTDFAELYMTYGEDVMWDYVGDPTDYSGAGIFPPGLTDCANRYLQTQQPSAYAAYNTMGVEFEELFKLIDAGYPVVLWTTMDYELPFLDEVAYYYDGDFYYWYMLEHCVTLFGYDINEGTVTINDPLQGVVTVDLAQMKAVYDEIGKMSMTIMKKQPGTVFETVATQPTTQPVSTTATRPRRQTPTTNSTKPLP